MLSLFKKHRNMVLLLIDMSIVFLSELFTWFLFFSDFIKAGIGRTVFVHISILNIIISACCFYVFKMYSVIWRYARIRHLARCFMTAFASVFLCFCFNILTGFPEIIPYETHLVKFILLAFLVIMSRIIYVLLYASYSSRAAHVASSKTGEKKRLMIVGAGEMASLFFDDLEKGNYENYEPVCMIDDDPAKIGRKLRGVPVAGTTEEIPSIAADEGIDVILVCIAHITEEDKKRILAKCYETKCHVSKMVMGMREGNESRIEKISIEDLLGRASVKLENNKLESFISGKTVMVTGGGGSIGSELSRHIASLKPKKLVIVDNYENNAYDIQQELIGDYGNKLSLSIEIVSVCDEDRMRLLFEEYRPEILYHAAARKHVPLMEHNPEEAVKNNIFGTYTTAKLASEYGVDKFVLVSTDKAVNPTNVMGATKRCCEMIVQVFDKNSETDFVAVRFGNVLGSNGSVIPLFKKQIEKGGPVTVTHPDIIRYFMTIPEAVQLLLAAGIMAKGGEIFVLDMGEPVRIADLARQLIRLSGHIPDVDIAIKYSGLRPGEKLYEELLMSEEGLISTENKKIFIGNQIDIEEKSFYEKLEQLKNAAEGNNAESVVSHLMDIVPTYHKASLVSQEKVLA